MKRRQFITLLGSAAVTRPIAARAQQAAIPVIGYLHRGSPEAFANRTAAFRKGLSEAGYIEGQSVTIEYRWAEGREDRLPELAADLVRRRVAVIATLGSTPAALAAKAATATIPIVFQVGADPVELGLVVSFNSPGGNITGTTSMNVELGTKRLGLLHELLPRAARFAVLINPNDHALAELSVQNAQTAAVAIGGAIEILAASSNREIDAAFASLQQKRVDALYVGNEGLFNTRRVQIVTLAAYHRMPAIYYARDFVEIGGLMSYGTNLTDLYRQDGIYTGRILKGEKPADMPIMRASKFEFLINLQTAKTLGLDIPPTLLARADDVIE